MAILWARLIGESTSLGIDIGGTGIKVTALRGQQILWTAKRGYRKPTVDDLVAAMQAIDGHPEVHDAVGLCVPGLLDRKRERVTLAVNVPALMDIRLDELVSQALNRKPSAIVVANDSIATGYDIFATRNLPGRLLVLRWEPGWGRPCWTMACPSGWTMNRPAMWGSSMSRSRATA